MKKILEVVDEESTVAPVKHGHWIKHEKTEKSDFYEECSICHCVYNEGGYMAYGYYCPHCGARMDEAVL